MSEYIPRLRQELVDAAARAGAGQRRRPAARPRRLVPVLAAAVVAAAVVLAVQALEVADDEPVGVPPGTALAYRVAPAPGDAAAAAAERSAEVLRERIAAAGIDGAKVSVADGEIGVDVAREDRDKVATLAATGELGIYDWEASVLGPDGRPAPGDASVTGGPGAGQQSAVSHYEAVARAAKAQSSGGPPTLWLVDDAARTVLAGPQWTRDALTDGASLPAGARMVEVPGGIRVVQSSGGAAGGWYALDDSAALENADVSDAHAASDPANGEPVVALDFTAHGQAAFTELTREVAQRGADGARPGEDQTRAWQHLAIVLDDRLVTVPFIDFQRVPDGIDGASGAQIQGGLSDGRARLMATILDTGPMPAALTPRAP